MSNILRMAISNTSTKQHDSFTVIIPVNPQLRRGQPWWRKHLLPACPCWQQQPHLDYGKNTEVLIMAMLPTLYLW